MAVLLYGSLLFGTSFALHLIVWKVRLPKRQTKVLFMLFIGVLCCGSLMLSKYSMKFSILNIHPPTSIAEYFQIWLYFISLTFAYIITYSAVEADSPSLLIIMKIYRSGAYGLSKEHLEREMDDSVLIEPRVRDLLTDKMAELHEGKYRLKRKGILLTRMFTFYRELIRVNKGG